MAVMHPDILLQFLPINEQYAYQMSKVKDNKHILFNT